MLLDMIFTEGGYRIIGRIDISLGKIRKVIIKTNYLLEDFDFSANKTIHFSSTADIIFLHHYDEKIVSLKVKFID
jgi:hypothetical protein